MANVINFVAGDSAPNFPIICTRAGAALDLTGATVKFKIANQDTGVRTNDAANTCTVVSATAGTCTYNVLATDFPTAGTYVGETQITYSNAEIETQPTQQVIIVRAAE